MNIQHVNSAHFSKQNSKFYFSTSSTSLFRRYIKKEKIKTLREKFD